MSGITKGPWEVARGCDQYIAAGGVWIASTMGTRGDEGAANARAIAAVPELIEAAQRLLAVFDQQKMTTAERIVCGISDAGLKTEGNAAINSLRAALAKALGDAS